MAGAAQFGGAVAASLNARFGASLAVNAAGGGSVGTFLLLALVPITAFLAAVTVWHADTLLLGLVLLPTAVFLLLAGQSVAAIGWLALLLGCVGARAAARPVRRKRLWGEMNSAAYAANVQTFLQVQKAAAAGKMCIRDRRTVRSSITPRAERSRSKNPQPQRRSPTPRAH